MIWRGIGHIGRVGQVRLMGREEWGAGKKVAVLATAKRGENPQHKVGGAARRPLRDLRGRGCPWAIYFFRKASAMIRPATMTMPIIASMPKFILITIHCLLAVSSRGRGY